MEAPKPKDLTSKLKLDKIEKTTKEKKGQKTCDVLGCSD